MTGTIEGALIALDWGTSSLRAMLVASDGAVLARRAQDWGIMRLPNGGFEAAYAAIVAGWHAPHAIACGMVGSAQGWRDVPYVRAPAGATELAAKLVRLRPQAGPALHIVPGVIGDNAGGQPNVMRGEETQIVGALAQHGAEGGLFLLPGTHSKWVRVDGGRIAGFETFMTGELFGLLDHHSILGRPAREADAAPGTPASAGLSRDAFTRGLVAARCAHQGLAPLLFSTRTLVLTRQIRAEESLDYLSGLLIGDEIRAGLALHGAKPDRPRCTLIGAPALVERYRLGLELFGTEVPEEAADAALDGLLLLARAAGLLTLKELT